tara:strand:- start:2 stop:145 length:144 start_codon:yes stop_codon:yes gene_type:complete
VKPVRRIPWQIDAGRKHSLKESKSLVLLQTLEAEADPTEATLQNQSE